MKRIDQILFHPKYQYALAQIKTWEQDRQFCRHDIGHFLDVARLAYIHCLERGLDVKKDVIYAAALLHDIGRYRQYEAGIPHEEASFDCAAREMCNWPEDKMNMVIRDHWGEGR